MKNTLIQESFISIKPQEDEKSSENSFLGTIFNLNDDDNYKKGNESMKEEVEYLKNELEK